MKAQPRNTLSLNASVQELQQAEQVTDRVVQAAEELQVGSQNVELGEGASPQAPAARRRRAAVRPFAGPKPAPDAPGGLRAAVASPFGGTQVPLQRFSAVGTPYVADGGQDPSALCRALYQDVHRALAGLRGPPGQGPAAYPLAQLQLTRAASRVRSFDEAQVAKQAVHFRFVVEAAMLLELLHGTLFNLVNAGGTDEALQAAVTRRQASFERAYVACAL